MRVLSLALALTVGALAASAGQPAPDFVPGGRWFNSAPLHLPDLRGQVVLVNLWVYSCINCANSLPTLKGWYARYKAQGLQIVGVHTPEFDSDRPAENVAAALKEEGVSWPVVQDNAAATWRAYGTRVWPTFYLIDRRGRLRFVHEGEISARFPQAIPGLERDLQTLLAER